jgi:hypothetical protein
MCEEPKVRRSIVARTAQNTDEISANRPVPPCCIRSWTTLLRGEAETLRDLLVG